MLKTVLIGRRRGGRERGRGRGRGSDLVDDNWHNEVISSNLKEKKSLSELYIKCVK